MNILVIDVGTSSMRGILYDGQARPLHLCRQKYTLDFVDRERVEVPPQVWREGLGSILRNVHYYCIHHHTAVDAVTLTCLRSATLAVDDRGEPLLNTIMWQDTRNAAVCDELADYEAEILQRTGAKVNTVFAGPKMAWIKQEEPEVYARAHKLLTVADYLLFLLTGRFVTDHTYGSRTSLMDLRTRCWDPWLLELYGLEEKKLCTLIPPGSQMGETGAALSQETGFPAGIPVFSAGGDQQCAALGQEISTPGTLSVTTGTGAYLAARIEAVPEAITGQVLCSVSAEQDSFILESSVLSCSSLYEWFARNFYADLEHPEGHLAEMDRAVAAAPPGAGGCMLLPFFQGRGTPDWNSRASGVFAGLSLSTSRADMARALLEGIVLEIGANVEHMLTYTKDIRRVIAGGGLTVFGAFNQLLADCTGLEVLRYSQSESTAMGAWASTAVEIGGYRSYGEALETARSGGEVEVFEPDVGLTAFYRELKQKQAELYRRLYQ